MPDIRGGAHPGAGMATASPAGQEPCGSPVFVLSASRSGSTLMRFILDSHPDLACPPETEVTAACSRLMHAWDILENASAGERSGTEAAGQPGSARSLAAIRDTVDGIYGRYLQRRGKRRWCDKSLGSPNEAELAARLYPGARFICLYRHCMDVIASGVEACPWGLHRFGFDGFAAQHPGNSVTAVGSYWLATVRSIMAFEESHPDVCHRVRYEDLVTTPEETAAAIFSFIGAKPVPGIARACFQTPHEGNGPGDEEIWFTSGIAADSVGRGGRVPVVALVPELRQGVNEALGRLGYLTVDDEWNALARAEVRADAAEGEQACRSGRPGRGEEPKAAVRAIGDRLRSRSDHELTEASAVWPAVAGQTVAIVAESPDGGHAELRWRFRALAGGSSRPAASPAGDRAAEKPVCTIIADPATWHALLSGESNLVIEMTAGRLRSINRRDGHRIRSDEVHAICWLLGLARVPLLRDSGVQVPERAVRDA
jgi:sulfotransferase family protein